MKEGARVSEEIMVTIKRGCEIRKESSDRWKNSLIYSTFITLITRKKFTKLRKRRILEEETHMKEKKPEMRMESSDR